MFTKAHGQGVHPHVSLRVYKHIQSTCKYNTPTHICPGVFPIIKYRLNVSHMNQECLYLHTKVHTQNCAYTCWHLSLENWRYAEYNRVLYSSSHSAMNSYSRSLSGSHSTHTVASVFHWPLNSPFNVALSETSLVSKLPVYFGGFGDFYLNMFK